MRRSTVLCGRSPMGAAASLAVPRGRLSIRGAGSRCSSFGRRSRIEDAAGRFIGSPRCPAASAGRVRQSRAPVGTRRRGPVALIRVGPLNTKRATNPGRARPIGRRPRSGTPPATPVRPCNTITVRLNTNTRGKKKNRWGKKNGSTKNGSQKNGSKKNGSKQRARKKNGRKRNGSPNARLKLKLRGQPKPYPRPRPTDEEYGE